MMRMKEHSLILVTQKGSCVFADRSFDFRQVLINPCPEALGFKS